MYGTDYSFRAVKNRFGLYELSVNNGWVRIPLRVRPTPSDPNSLSRGTSTGNYHGPYIERREYGREFLMLDFTDLYYVTNELTGMGVKVYLDR